MNSVEVALGIKPVGLPMESYLADRSDGSISLPLIVSRKVPEQDRLVVLVHEVLHRLFTRNDRYAPEPGTTDLLNCLRIEFGFTTFATIVHIPVFAALCMLHEDNVLGSEELHRHRERHHANRAYLDAWHYVDRRGYSEIIFLLKTVYEELDSAHRRHAA